MSLRSWAHYAIEDLRQGKSTTLTPHGSSMAGKVEDGDDVLVVPPRQVAVGDIVLVRVKGNDYLHLVKAQQGKRLLIGNNRGGTNGWVGPSAIYGVATTVAGKVVKTFVEPDVSIHTP